MKINGISFDPIRRTYGEVEVLHATNRSNEDYLNELKKENPNLKVVRINSI